MSLLRSGDLDKHEVIPKVVQDVPLSRFDELRKNDILFIDSSHVSKTGSDVNYIFFEILPRLRSGVLIHVHDVPYPFEYGEDIVYEGRAWNEAYVLRAFLQFNRAFELLLYPSYLTFQRLTIGQDSEWGLDIGKRLIPKCMDPLGPSLSLRKV